MANADSSLPLIQTITPERWAGLSMDFIAAGYVGLLVKNGQLVRRLTPGRHFSFAIPWIEQAQIILVDTKLRNLEVISRGDFLSLDQYLVNVSLSVLYQVIDPKRVALEISDPIAALTSAVKDTLGVIVNQMRLSDLVRQGRVDIRQHLISHLDFYSIGFNLEDVRVGDISFPQARGVVRQIEGLTARAEAEHEIALRSKIAESDQTIRLQLNHAELNQRAESIVHPTIAASENRAALPPHNRVPLPPTTLADPPQSAATARLVHQRTGAIVPLSVNPFTIGRELDNSLVSEDSLCSRRHARIERVLNAENHVQYQLIDVGSSNGTYVNNQRLVAQQPIVLSPGSLIRIGNDEWLFEADV
jgi:regulator of protease activity HflC (stomatin/prohibitin superfamily)